MIENIKIELKDLSKKFKEKTVLDSVNYTFEGGKVYGLCGINGSGKTMLLRAISGLIKPTGGEVIFHSTIEPKNISIGITLNKVGFFEELSAFDNLSLLASLRNKIKKEVIKESISKVGLDPTDARSVSKYSLGMRQRLSLAQAIMENPEILLLDEPTNALDEEGVDLVHNIIREEKAKGKLIILTSHNKYDINTLSDVVLRMKEGRLTEDEE